ncbi:hypothetical protein WH47_11798 [Habropoda laboriosa]|uniref:Uncharacterized protein n=1 Tax=Habropoda laboriosa TaxID=597456 RepID=A0A0L7R8P5_9HYME|nr:hypothetical protein WH47_11798 [Habropoda laboriosa]
MLVDDCGSAMGWTSASVRGGWSTPGGCRNSAMSFGGSVPSLHPAGSIRSLRSQHSMQGVPETPRRCMHCHPVHVPSTPSNYVHHPMQYYTPSHCPEPRNGVYTPYRGNSYHGVRSKFPGSTVQRFGVLTAEFKDPGFDTIKFKGSGVDATALKDSGVDTAEFKDSGVTTPRFKDSTVLVIESKDFGDNLTAYPKRGLGRREIRWRQLRLIGFASDNFEIIGQPDDNSGITELANDSPGAVQLGIDVAGMRTHFYPEGGWGWLVCAAGFLALLLTTGMQLAFGLLHVHAERRFGEEHIMDLGMFTYISLILFLYPP